MKNIGDSAILVNDEWYNIDFNRFSINPKHFYASDNPGGRFEDGALWGSQKELVEFGARLDRRIDDYKKRSSVGRRTIIRELINLHSDGLILWPLSFMFGRSVLGHLGLPSIIHNVAKIYPQLAAIRSDFEKGAYTAPKSDATVKIRPPTALTMWELLVGLRFASTASINSVEDFKAHHFNTIVSIIKPNGTYHPEVPGGIENGLRGLARFYGGTLDINMPRRPASEPHKPQRTLVDRRPPHLDWLVQSWEEWMNAFPIRGRASYKRALSLLVEYFSKLPEEACSYPAQAFSRSNMKGLLAYQGFNIAPAVLYVSLSKIRQFSDWLSVHGIDDDGEPHFPPMLHQQDLKRLNLRRGAAKSVSRREMTRPMPLKFHAMLKEIVSGNDFAWPRSLRDGATNNFSQFVQLRSRTGEFETVFCPVLARLLLLHLELPIRNIQARRLDSGEGDERRWMSETGKWGPNTGKHAGHWRRAEANNVARGAIHEIETYDGGTITGLWINSNKTQDIKNVFDDTSGYRIPWENEDVLENLDAMRQWQETYNAVSGPLPHAALSPVIFKDDPTPVVGPHLPDHFYLFRYPGNHGERGREQPPSYHTFLGFFNLALQELERRWNLDNPDREVTIIEERVNGMPTRTRFTIHGMRAATLTGLHQAGVPIGIISKLIAGHASILMTLGYMHYDPQHVSEVIGAARVAADANKQAAFETFLKAAKFEDALRVTAGIGDDPTLTRDGRLDLSICSRLDIGICPNGATLCHAGTIGRKVVEIEAPGGARNCVRCRFFRTGYPFLLPLVAHANALLAKATGYAMQAREQDAEVLRMKAERVALRDESKPIPPELSHRINSVSEAFLANNELRDRLLADFHLAQELVQKVRALPDWESSDTDTPNLPSLPSSEVPKVVGRETSRYEVADAVVHASRFYPSMESPDLERERDAITDRLAYAGGFMPPLIVLPLAERKRAGDALAKLFIMALTSSDIDDLVSGCATWGKFKGLEERFRMVCQDIAGIEVPRLGQQRAPTILNFEAEAG